MKFIAFFVFLLSFSAMSKHLNTDETLRDVKDTLGFVPEFIEIFPPEGRPGVWEQMKTLEISSKTALPGVTKSLISIAVGSQIPCKYCLYFDTKSAKAEGADDRQIREAIALAASSRFWPTNFAGLQIDFKELKKEVEEIVKFKKKQMEPGYKAPDLAPIEITDAESVYKDIEREWGLVPSIFKKLTKDFVPGVWKDLKGVYVNPKTSLPAKTKILICLAVEAQIPDKYLIYWNTEMAKLVGASEQEIAEAVEMAAATRYWSTWLNGNQFDEKKFKKEVDKIFSKIKK